MTPLLPARDHDEAERAISSQPDPILAKPARHRPDTTGTRRVGTSHRKQIEDAQRENRADAAASRALASELRAAGLSVSDTARVLGVFPRARLAARELTYPAGISRVVGSGASGWLDVPILPHRDLAAGCVGLLVGQLHSHFQNAVSVAEIGRAHV